jgi:hypothetical protein
LALRHTGGTAAALFVSDAGDALSFSDKSGKPRAMLGARGIDTSLDLYDEAGTLRASLGNGDLKNSETGSTEHRAESSLVLFKEDGKVAWEAPQALRAREVPKQPAGPRRLGLSLFRASRYKASMKLCHAAALALVGWYLMMPPLIWEEKEIGAHPLAFHIDFDAPISKWDTLGSFDSAEQCQDEGAKRVADLLDPKKHLLPTRPDDPLLKRAQAQLCIASDDVRLSGDYPRIPPTKSSRHVR